MRGGSRVVLIWAARRVTLRTQTALKLLLFPRFPPGCEKIISGSRHASAEETTVPQTHIPDNPARGLALSQEPPFPSGTHL